jgi:hypothetical protein
MSRLRLKPSTDYAELNLCNLWIFLFLLFGHVTVSAQIVQVVTDEADAVLFIVEKRERGEEITEADWQRLFQTEGYVRLKQREHSLQRSFEDDDFKKFVLSSEMGSRRKALAETLSKWKETDIQRIAQRPRSYLPAGAVIRAKVYLVIKPRDNSFVFDVRDNPAIFMYLDPSKSRELFENHLAHELHHIGYGTACPPADTTAAVKKLSPRSQKVLQWIGAFGEGFAMLAAAGGPDIHPHSVSKAEDRARWDRDVENFNNDLKTVEKFFLTLMEGKLSDDEENKKGFSFFGVQGPWYTVGWQMAAVIEKTFGRKKLIECFCDSRKLLPTFNDAARRNRRAGGKQYALWSEQLLAQIK